MVTLNPAVQPPAIMVSMRGPKPRPRAVTIPGIVSIGIKELFPDIQQGIYSFGDDLSIIRKATEDALAGVNMSMIQSQDTVNILCCEDGFTFEAGEPYAEMIRTIKDIVEESTKCENIRLRISAGAQAKELVQQYKFDQHFNGQWAGMTGHEKGVPIETEVGTLYGVARAYDADWIIHAAYTDLRELYVHRLINRSLKAFAMSYARVEVRGVYHFNFGPRSSNFLPKAIFDSPFVQDKFALACILAPSPMGISEIAADKDLYELDRRLLVNTLESYGKLLRLFAEIDECIVVLDQGMPPYYVHAGGMTFGNLITANVDYFDLDTVPAGTAYALFERDWGAPKIKAVNPSIKALVINHIGTGFWSTELPINIPTVVVGRDLADLWITSPSNLDFMNYAVTAESLEAAMSFARRITGTHKVILFDGSFGSINLSPPMAEFMLTKAPEVSRRVDEEFLPKWLRQRGIDPKEPRHKGI